MREEASSHRQHPTTPPLTGAARVSGLHENHLFHQGANPVRKSCSVHGVTAMLPSCSVVCASERESGAGPRTTLPFSSYWEPWHGQQKRLAALFQGTVQPRCVQTAPTAKSLMPSALVMM